jgi:SHS2 domain-containing protein
MSEGFTVIEHTADVGIVAYGGDLEELYINAARGMLSLVIDMDTIKSDISKNIDINENDEDALLVAWLNELLYILDTEHVILKDFEIEKLTSVSLSAKCYGETLDFKRHKLKREVKAATYYGLSIIKVDDQYSARIIFDI